jgi:radical SAM protein with 4Fe4S-binding SPASM domain
VETTRFGRTGLNFLGTSIEGPGERHDAIRRLDGAFERSMEGMRAVRDARGKAGKRCPMLHATTVIQDENVDVLHELPAMLKEGGIDVMNLVTETRMHDLPGLGEADPASFKKEDMHWPKVDRAQLTEALDRTAAAAKEAGIGLRMPRMPRKDIIDYYEEGIALEDYECRNAWNTLIIGRQGSVYPCWIVRVGNVRENSIKEIWNGPAMRAFRQTCQKHLFAMCPGCCFLEHKSKRTAT